MTILRFRAEVASDLGEAHRWYEDRSAAAAQRFLDELERVFTRIERSPIEFPIVHREIRRALLHRFPYAVFFLLETEATVVLGIFHQAVHPAAWQDRES